LHNIQQRNGCGNPGSRNHYVAVYCITAVIVYICTPIVFFATTLRYGGAPPSFKYFRAALLK